MSIFNGSFVILGKALKYCGRNIHITVTMLLAPGTSRSWSLCAIGRLHVEYWRIKEDLEDMQIIKKGSRKIYWVCPPPPLLVGDVLISLNHASWMEVFNFNIGVVGIPFSLSTLASNYVKMDRGVLQRLSNIHELYARGCINQNNT